MKTTIQNATLKLFSLIMLLTAGFDVLAQEATGSSETTTKSYHSSSSVSTAPDPGAWYMNPIVWVIGGVVLLLIIIMAVRGGNTSSNTVSRTTTTTTTLRED